MSIGDSRRRRPSSWSCAAFVLCSHQPLIQFRLFSAQLIMIGSPCGFISFFRVAQILINFGLFGKVKSDSAIDLLESQNWKAALDTFGRSAAPECIDN